MAAGLNQTFLLSMHKKSGRATLTSSFRAWRFSILPALLTLAFIVTTTGCNSIFGVKRTVSVTPLLAPLKEATTEQLLAEINRIASVNSIRGKVDVQFLDTSFAELGIAEKYRTADGMVVLQRPNQILLTIQVPLVGTEVAQMTSDGERFRVAVLQGEERYKRFLRGTNNAVYPRLEMNEAGNSSADNANRNRKNRNGKRAATDQAVGTLSGLRPQHFTDALLLKPVAQPDTSYIYTRAEIFQEEANNGATNQTNNSQESKKNTSGRVLRGYYTLDELMPETAGRARLLRRFWFDRFENLRLARLQTFDERGSIVTDVIYRTPKSFGAETVANLPTQIEITRPQDRYSISITYQAPEAVILNRAYDKDVFVLENKWQLQEVDLDKQK